MPAGYVVYGGELSLFTRKLEAAMAFYGADYVREAKTQENAELIERRSGTHQVPVLLTPENWMISDTTPLLEMLDGRFPDRAMFPPGEMGVLVHILEEHFDEWIARVMVHYRWHYPASAKFAAQRMANGNPEVVKRMLDWGPRACRATGTDSAQQRDAAEAEYLRILQAAEKQLNETAFLLGDRPTALDCIVLGGLRAHTHMDPDPKKVTAQFPTVVDWAERRAEQWDGTGELAPFDAPTDFALHVLGEMASTYSPYVLANRDAQHVGAKAFHVEIYGEDVSYLSRPYPEASRNRVIERIKKLDSKQSRKVQAMLSSIGLSGTFD
jgi:glutathione S-transferase